MYDFKTVSTLMLATALLGANAVAAPILFQEGVSPNASFTTPDKTMRSGNANFSYGGNLDVGQLTGVARAVITFDLSEGLQSTDQIQSITLDLTQTRQSAPNGASIELYEVEPFVESQVTWNNASASEPWTTPGGDYNENSPLTSAIDSADDGETVTFASTAAFITVAEDALQNNNGLLNLILASPDLENRTSNSGYVSFEDGEGPTSSDRPLLSVTLVPEPGSMALLALGGLMALSRGRGSRRTRRV